MNCIGVVIIFLSPRSRGFGVAGEGFFQSQPLGLGELSVRLLERALRTEHNYSHRCRVCSTERGKSLAECFEISRGGG